MVRKAPTTPPVAIERGKVYRLPEFLRITKLGHQGLRDCRDLGFRVVYLGSGGYVSGDDWCDFVADPARVTTHWAQGPAREKKRVSRKQRYE